MNEASSSQPDRVRKEFRKSDLPVTVEILRSKSQSVVIDLDIGVSAGAVVVVVVEERLEYRLRKGHVALIHE